MRIQKEGMQNLKPYIQWDKTVHIINEGRPCVQKGYEANSSQFKKETMKQKIKIF